MKMKKIAALLLAVSMVVSMAACGKANETTTASDAVTEKKDSVVIAIGTEPDTLDPTKGWGHGNAPIVQSTLVRYTKDLTFENDLATDYDLSPDGLTWTFMIRDDAKFTDGEPVTAEDVAFTLETAKAAQGSVDLTYMESAVAQDDTTVVITLSQPTSIFLNTLASVGIVPEHAYSEDYGTNPMGSGPYKFVEWKTQEQIIFTANEDYYGGAPYSPHFSFLPVMYPKVLKRMAIKIIAANISTSFFMLIELCCLQNYHPILTTSDKNKNYFINISITFQVAIIWNTSPNNTNTWNIECMNFTFLKL